MLSILKLGTKPPDLSHADDGAGENGDGEMEVGTAFVADAEAPEAGEPGEGSFHNPPVSAKMGAALYATSRDPWLDATGTALPAAASVIVAFVGVQFFQALNKAEYRSGAFVVVARQLVPCRLRVRIRHGRKS